MYVGICRPSVAFHQATNEERATAGIILCLRSHLGKPRKALALFEILGRVLSDGRRSVPLHLACSVKQSKNAALSSLRPPAPLAPSSLRRTNVVERHVDIVSPLQTPDAGHGVHKETVRVQVGSPVRSLGSQT